MKQRKISFRCFWKHRKEMEYDIQDTYDWEAMPTQTSEDINCILMQFIGLLDKNGKEIYEGDIVKYSNKYVKDHIYEVPEIRDCFLTNMIGYEIENRMDSVCEVIGNIYETPELI